MRVIAETQAAEMKEEVARMKAVVFGDDDELREVLN